MTTTVMPMGDSITGGGPAGSYRANFYWDMGGENSSYQFVGDQHNNPSGYLPDDQTANEGVGGITTSEMNDYVSASQIVAATQPDMVMLMIGTNDYGRLDPWQEVSQLSNLIDTIHSQDPGTVVLTASLLARADDGPGGWIDQVNSMIPGMLATKPNVAFVDMHSFLNTGDLVDGLHPSAEGNATLGGEWAWAAATQTLGHTPW